ncbi:peptidylprolyl isomerase [Marinimicrobium sp. ARAG 43.8]|uniref:peptidylprolyl isomerase n=1 Tax=Marinimicrobium sp. ARAG 43.8 TaxID=3418719 RepID=UPI003CE9A722
MHKSLLAAGALASTLLLTSGPAAATIVEIETSLGNIQVNLYDESTPKTVANFLSYVEGNSYDGTFIHRSVPGFIVQGGGYRFDAEGEVPEEIETEAAVVNEPEWSNRQGTIAMAKVRGRVNSATSQWFFNLENNHTNLDQQNGGFTVFGEIISGMSVVEEIAELPRFNYGSVFTDLPLRNYDEDDADNKVPLSSDHFVVVLSVNVIDDREDSAADLNPVPNTLIDQVDQGGGGGSSSGGAMGWFSLLGLAGLGWIRRRSVKRTVV